MTVDAGVNPTHAVPVIDFSEETLSDIVAHLEVSRAFEHFVYREAELDAVWSLIGFSLHVEADPDRREVLRELHRAAHEAHDLLGERRPGEAAERLRRFTGQLTAPEYPSRKSPQAAPAAAKAPAPPE